MTLCRKLAIATILLGLVFTVTEVLPEPATAEARSKRRRKRKVRKKRKTAAKARKGRSARRRRRRRRRKRRRRTSAPPKAEPPRVVTPAPPPKPQLTAEEALLVRKLGAPLLKKMKSMGLTAKSFLYATRLATVGIKNYRKGEYGDAIYLLNKAFGLVPSPNLKFYLAQIYEKLSSFLKARRHYQRFLKLSATWTLTPANPKFLATARTKVVSLQGSLIQLRVGVNQSGAEILVNGEFVGKSPLRGRLWLMPGMNTLVVRKQGFVKQELVLKGAKKGTRITRQVKLITRAETLRQNRLYLAEKRRKELLKRRLAQQLRDRRLRAEKRQRALRLSGYSVMGVGVAAIIVGGIFGGLGQKHSSTVADSAASSSWLTVKDDYDKARTYWNVSYYTIGAGAVVAITGAILTILGHRKAKVTGQHKDAGTTVQLTPCLGPGSAGLTVDVDF